MNSDILRYLVPNHGPDVEALKRCLSLAIKVSQDKGFQTITLLIINKKNFENTIVADVLGRQVIKYLLKKEKVQAIGNIYFELESLQTFNKYASYEIIIGLYLTQKGIDVLDAVLNTKVVIYLPWLEDEAKDWIDRWDPIIFGGDESQKPTLKLDPIIEEELRNLTSLINLSTGLGHPSDKQHAKKTFAKLQSKRLRFNPNDIKNWAIRNGWLPEHADELAKLASKYTR
jgi:hypothetical protein